MQGISKNALLRMGLFSALFLSVTMLSANPDKLFDKVSVEVASASPDDWMTYAKSAEKMIRKRSHLNEAKEWISKSLAIKETASNLEIMGDYYMANNLPEEAVNFYLKSMQSAQMIDFNVDVSDVQQKMFKAKQQSEKA
ncbi:MAG: hypothetical protein O2887_05445 [Bacteroidetes bacterium]|nr:hypothetical protein [Bacteroidota bacterium]MDA1119926.1 hypothetical protein [Bacteroidota bacterium]